MEQNGLTSLDTSKDLLELSTTKLLDDFGSGSASPGSGSAAALLSLLSAKMLLTVCDISLKKDACKKSHKNFEYIINLIEARIESDLKDIFKKDSQDFQKVVNLRIKRDKETTGSKKAEYTRKSFVLLEATTDYMFQIAEISLTLMGYGILVFEDGWHAIRGDSGVAISASMSGVMSSIFIINLNLKTLKRRRYAHQNIKKCQEIQNKLESLQSRAFSCVTSISSESLKSIQLELKVDENT